MRKLFEQSDDALQETLRSLRDQVVECAATIMYDCAAKPGEQVGETVLPEPFSKTQQLHSRLDGGEEIEMIKHAGFSGVCFDIEETNGGMELIEAFERAFKALTKAGLEVMITTSHSAPYSAKTDEIRIAFVESWIKSPDVTYISPQLYTSGYEANADFGQTPCSPQDGIFDSKCSWERLAPMKALWAPSLKDVTHYQPTKEYFAKAGIKTHGFVQWADSGGGSAYEQ